MVKRYQDTYGRTLRALDCCVVVGAWLLSFWIRYYVHAGIPQVLTVAKSFPSFSKYAALSPLIAAIWVTVLTLGRVYEASILIGRAREAKLLLKSHGIALLVFISMTYFYEEFRYSRLVMTYFAIIGGVGMLTLHFALRTVLRNLRRGGLLQRRTLAIGEGAGMEQLIDRLNQHPELGLQIQGVVTSEGAVNRKIGGKPVLGRYADITEFIRAQGVNEVIIAMPPSQSHELDELLHALKDETVDVRVVPDVHRFVTIGCEIEVFDGFPILRLNDSPVVGWGAIVKRISDIVVSSTALVFLSPILLLIAAGVRLTSRGRVLYAQERMGLDGQGFRMLKFRTMREDAEVESGAVWARKGDNRCTPLGAFLRKTSLDELPQLLNVLRGDMSLVGPRPERPMFVDKFRYEIPHYMLRHKVRTGITGWAQVNGWRGNTSLNRRIECDLFYIKNWSIGLDLKILVMTLWRGFIHKNAY
jgi:Undecaprenyl-phosphate glucose phosphotransferase